MDERHVEVSEWSDLPWRKVVVRSCFHSQEKLRFL